MRPITGISLYQLTKHNMFVLYMNLQKKNTDGLFQKSKQKYIVSLTKKLTDA